MIIPMFIPACLDLDRCEVYRRWILNQSVEGKRKRPDRFARALLFWLAKITRSVTLPPHSCWRPAGPE